MHNPAVHSAAPSRGASGAMTSLIHFLTDPIPEAADGLNDGCAKFSPEPCDEHFDRVRVTVETLCVDVLRQLSLGHDTPAVMHQYERTRNSWLVSFTCTPSSVTRAMRGSSATAPARSSGVIWPLARRINARSRARTSSILNGLAT